MVRCSNIRLGWSKDRPTANPNSTAPYAVYVYRGGYQPIVVVDNYQERRFNWTVQLPLGGPNILTIVDANGYFGGNSLVFDVQAPFTDTCDTNPMTPNSLNITTSGSLCVIKAWSTMYSLLPRAECSAIIVNVDGGVPPYTMQIVPSQAYQIDIGSGEQFFVKVSDSAGNVGVNGLHTVVNGDPICSDVAPTITSGMAIPTLTYNAASTTTSITPTITTPPIPTFTNGHAVVSNTGSQEITTTVALPDGGSSTVVLAPGATATIDAGRSSDGSPNLGLIIGLAGGGAVLLTALILFGIMYRKRTNRQKREQEQREAYERRRLSDGEDHPSPTFGATSTDMTQSPMRPLMQQLNSSYSNVSPGIVSPGGGTSSTSYFDQTHGTTTSGIPTSPVNLVTPGSSHSNANAAGPSISSVQPHSAMSSLPSLSRNLPAGAMPPLILVGGQQSVVPKSPLPITPGTPGQPRSEKATFVPRTESADVAPPYQRTTSA
ncbi:hypothetical protein PIIN_03942 [Serendipita indica DSM 11827]|uniref:Uncharacterized protein n=1 Tax=Serendipita indica (strain DSM 11827) TaxID=1109443 RepID=G4TFA1_SERID|nr:hypothetical protein PIIN_03942 [Serendipita indica DSM 11827]